MSVISNIVVGKPDTTPSKPSHQAGVKQGNRQPGRGRSLEDALGPVGYATATRSTGINAKDREPVDRRMPRLTPP